MQPFAIDLRSIAHSIAKEYYVTHTYSTQINTCVCIHVLKYFRLVTPQMTSLLNGVDARSARNSRKFRKVLCFFTWQKDKQLRPANRIRQPRAFFGQPTPACVSASWLGSGLSFFALDRIKSQAKCSPRACVFYAFCFCFSAVDVVVVRASFITPYFMLVLAFCLLLSFRLWIVVKFFVIINFFSFDAFFGFCFRERLWVGLVTGRGTNAKVILATTSFGASFSY